MKAISSRQNPLIDELREVRDHPPDHLLFLEGPKLLDEALKSNLPIERLLFVPTLLESPLIQTACAIARDKIQITPYVLKGLSDVEAPQGVIAIARKPLWTWELLTSGVRSTFQAACLETGSDPSRKRTIVILDGIQNAGNAATIVRTAEAAGAAGIITTPGSAGLFSAKALRGAMGSSLRLPILEHQPISVIADQLQAASYVLVLASSPSADSLDYTHADIWTNACALVIGQEGNGLSQEWKDKDYRAIHIPMVPAVESLNVAAAAAILLYEARRH